MFTHPAAQARDFHDQSAETPEHRHYDSFGKKANAEPNPAPRQRRWVVRKLRVPNHKHAATSQSQGVILAVFQKAIAVSAKPKIPLHMKFHRPLTSQERRELSRAVSDFSEIMERLAAVRSKQSELLRRKVANQNEQAALRQAARSGETDAALKLIAAERAGTFIEAGEPPIERDEAEVAKHGRDSARRIWSSLLILGKEMELSYQESIALELRRHFVRKDMALDVAARTDTAAAIAFYFKGDRYPFTAMAGEWGTEQLEFAFGFISKILSGLLTGGDVVPDIEPYPVEDERAQAAA